MRVRATTTSRAVSALSHYLNVPDMSGRNFMWAACTMPGIPSGGRAGPKAPSVVRGHEVPERGTSDLVAGGALGGPCLFAIFRHQFLAQDTRMGEAPGPPPLLGAWACGPWPPVALPTLSSWAPPS